MISSGQKYAAGSKSCFDETQIYLQKNKLNKNYRYIGIIKDKEVLSLIYYSLALINPLSLKDGIPPLCKLEQCLKQFYYQILVLT